MLLKSIEISGFKSFAKKDSLTFNTPISAIVGPNGSGKSNVAEAFRFVLGEQSIKSLRGKKGEDLIFNGAGEGARANRASVKVIFDNSQKIFALDFPEVQIERVVHRDGINEYLINGSQVRLRDIIELLAGAHIGSSGHHIISQGEADRILNSSLRERRAMLEDALGLKIYQYKRVESERKLDKTLENIQSVESLRKEIAPHLRFLKKQVEKIEKASELKNTLTDLAREYFKLEDIYINTSKNAISSERTPLQEKKSRLEKELSDARAVLEKSKNKDAQSEKVIELEKNIHNVRTDLDKVLQEIGKLQGELSSEERILAKQKEIIASEEHKTIPLREVEDVAKRIDVSIDEAEKSTDFSFIKKTLSVLRSTLRDFIQSKKSETNDSIIKESETSIANLKKVLEEKSNSLSQIRTKDEAFQKEHKTLQADIDKEKDSSRDAEKALFRIMSEQNEVTGSLALLASKEDGLRTVEQDFKRELEECAMLVGRGVLDFKNFKIEGDLPHSATNSAEATLAKEATRGEQEERRRTIEKIKIRLEEAGLSGSGEIMKEFQETSERDAFLERELTDLDKSAESLRQLIVELGEKLDIEFKEGITKINKQFNEFFALMFGGGKAMLNVIKETKRIKKETDDLLLTTDNEPEEEIVEDEATEDGIDIEVSLPRKKIKGLAMLSGGERALTSIALLFAISQVNPPPFIILDETDAALDEANSRKYGDMVENLAKYSQLILITHNRETMSRAGVIYGVTMGSAGVSKILSIQFEEAAEIAK